MTPDLSLVICTLDESDSIASVLAEVEARLSHLSLEIIVVDDSDDERTAGAVRDYPATTAQVHLLHRRGERGLASAANAGWLMARGRVLGLMDGDGQHDPDLLAKLFEGLQGERCDIAVASRYMVGAVTGLIGFRQALSQSGTALAKALTGVNTTDPLAGCFLFTRAWWDEAKGRMAPVGYKVLLDLVLSGRRAPKVFESPTALRARIGGVSKLDTRVIADMAAQLIEKRSAGLISARFVLFGAVGASGVIVNVGLLTGLSALGMAYWVAQACAVFVAMTSNFALNNLLTFRDRRLTGPAFWRGLTAFALACTGGAVVNEAIGAGLHALGLMAPASALCGAVAAAAWNYTSASKLAWGGKTKTKTSPADFFAADGQGRAKPIGLQVK